MLDLAEVPSPGEKRELCWIPPEPLVAVAEITEWVRAVCSEDTERQRRAVEQTGIRRIRRWLRDLAEVSATVQPNGYALLLASWRGLLDSAFAPDSNPERVLREQKESSHLRQAFEQVGDDAPETRVIEALAAAFRARASENDLVKRDRFRADAAGKRRRSLAELGEAMLERGGTCGVVRIELDYSDHRLALTSDLDNRSTRAKAAGDEQDQPADEGDAEGEGEESRSWLKPPIAEHRNRLLRGQERPTAVRQANAVAWQILAHPTCGLFLHLLLFYTDACEARIEEYSREVGEKWRSITEGNGRWREHPGLRPKKGFGADQVLTTSCLNPEDPQAWRRLAHTIWYATELDRYLTYWPGYPEVSPHLILDHPERVDAPLGVSAHERLKLADCTRASAVRSS